MNNLLYFLRSKLYPLLFIGMLLSSACFGQKVAGRYLKQHSPIAIRLMYETGIPASIILGVSMIESAMGTSKNCRLMNNYFGIKGHNSLHKTKSKHRSAYKQYPDAEASFRHFAKIVMAKKWYPSMQKKKDYHLWLVKLNKTGYAEAKGRWIKDIESVIEKYNLCKYDSLGIDFIDNRATKNNLDIK
jgi:Bax protein